MIYVSSDDRVISSMLNGMDNGIMLQNTDGKVLFVNSAFEELLGYSHHELVGLNNKDIIRMLVGEEFYREIQVDISNVYDGISVVKKRKLMHKSGQYIPLEVKGIPVYEDDKCVVGEMLTFKDLHEELIVKITKLVNSSLTLEEVLKNTTTAAVDHVGLASCAIFLLNEEKTKLQLAACNVFNSKEDCEKVVFNLGEGPPGIIAQKREPVYVRNLRTEPSLPEHVRQLHSDKASIGFPLVSNDELLGVIAFDADVVRKFSSKEVQLFENMASQVALAIYNARVFTHLEHLSITDGLTGLYNHRYFQERLQEEIRRTDRSDGHLSLLMLDVDKFKNYNDTFGHVFGDELLKHLADLIRQSVRNFDVVARYGGEEFTVILIDCSKEEALKIATRIKNTIENYEFYGREKQPDGKVTVSIGLAMYRKPLSNKNLLHNADKALYTAKNNGRNRIEVFAS